MNIYFGLFVKVTIVFAFLQKFRRTSLDGRTRFWALPSSWDKKSFNYTESLFKREKIVDHGKWTNFIFMWGKTIFISNYRTKFNIIMTHYFFILKYWILKFYVPISQIVAGYQVNIIHYKFLIFFSHSHSLREVKHFQFSFGFSEI